MGTHRGFMRSFWLATGAAIVLSAASVQTAGAQAPVTDKWITVLVQAEPPAIDNCNSNRSYEGPIIKHSVVEPLIERNGKDGSLMPKLATSWKQMEPTRWRLTLQEGVTFHDGAPFNADTLATSMERTLGTVMKDAGQFCSVREKFFLDIDIEVRKVDDHTVDLVTSQPDPILPTRLTFLTVDSPNTRRDQHSLAPVGTGPFVFDSWTPGQDIRLVRNPDYWGPQPQAEGVRYIWRDESAVRAAMVEVGEADIAFNIAPQHADNPDLDYSYLNSETTYLRIDLTRPPLDDKRVRLALNYAVDREAIRGSILSKDLVHATQMVMPSIPGHNHALDKKVRQYDPEKARQLLAEAKADGAPIDKEIVLYVRPPSHPGAEEVGEALQQYYGQVGLNIKLMNVEPGQYNEINNKPFAEDRPPSLTHSQHDNNTGDPIFSALKYSCKGPQSMLCDAKVDAEIDRIAQLGGEERVKAWQELFRVFYEDIVADVWLYHMVANARVSKRITFAPDFTSNTEIHVEKVTFK